MIAPALALFLVQIGRVGPDPVSFDAATAAKILTHAPLGKPPPDPTNRFADDPAAAALGKRLFYEKRFSSNGAIACATCHDPAKAFADGKSLSEGIGTGTRHVPTLLNAAFQRWWFWDGRADSMWSQALHPLESASEMGGERGRIAREFAKDAELRRAYEEVFGAMPDPGEPAGSAAVLANTGKALEAYERLLVSGDSEFDRFADALRSGDREGQARYPEAAKRGLALFVGKANCRLCHAGPLFSDGEFHNIGVPTLDKSPPKDAGRFGGIDAVQRDPFNAASPHSDDPKGERADELTRLVKTSETWGEFRTPTLRNVARTAPYMHQGQFATLRDVLHYYSTLEGTVPAGHHGEQVIKPLHLADAEIDDLLAFLGTLNGADPAGAGPTVRPWKPKGISSPKFESHAAFDPRSRDVYFVRSSPQFTGWRILVSRCTAEGWSTPEPPSFAGDGVEADPCFTKDGKSLYFISTRSRAGANGKDLDIWRVDRDAGGTWGTPVRLPEPVNSPSAEWFPRPAPDGSLYFGSDRPGGFGATDLWRARADGSGVWTVENLGAAVNTPGHEYEPEISPDGKRLVFMAEGGLFESRRTEAGWSPRTKLGPEIDVNGSEIGPLFSPSGRSLLFSRDTGGSDSGEFFVWCEDGSETWPPECN
jgi:cytochrome c peroxidase